MTLDYIDPTDKGARYVVELLSSFIGQTSRYWVIVDRNTGEFMRGNRQPDNRSRLIWKSTHDVAALTCAALNDRVKPALMDPGTGPDAPARSVDVNSIRFKGSGSRGQALPVFVACVDCGRCHRALTRSEQCPHPFGAVSELGQLGQHPSDVGK